MAKRSFLDNLLNSFAKSADKAIKKAIIGDKTKKKRSTSPARSQNQRSGYEVIKMMVDNRVRILNESVQLVENSKNLKVIVSRKNVALEHLDWFSKNEQYGAILNPSPEQSRSALFVVFNERLYSRVEDLVLIQLEKVNSLKTWNAKSNATNKAELIIQDNIGHFIQNASNYDEINRRIEILVRKVADIRNSKL